MERRALLDALNTIKPAINERENIEEFAHVWFDKKHLMASNDIGFGIQVPFETDIEFGMRGKLLIGLLSNLTAKEISFVPVEDDPGTDDKEMPSSKKVKLIAGKTKATLSILPLESRIAEIPNVAKAKTFKASASLLGALGSVMLAKDKKPDASVDRQGVTLLQTKEYCHVFMTDNESIAWARVKPETVPLKEDERRIVPTDFVEELLKTSRGEPTELCMTNNLIFAKNEKMLLFSPLVGVVEPQDLLGTCESKLKPAVFLSIPSRLKLALARSAVILPDSSNHVVLQVSKNTLIIKSTSILGDLRDTMPLEGSKPMPEVTTKLVPSVVQRGIGQCEEIFIGAKYVIMRSKNFTYLVASL